MTKEFLGEDYFMTGVVFHVSNLIMRILADRRVSSCLIHEL